MKSNHRIDIQAASERKLQQVKLKHNINENQVIQQNKQNITYFLPSYVRFFVREINQIDKDRMEASIDGVLFFSFYYGGIKPQRINEFIQFQNVSRLEIFRKLQSAQQKLDFMGQFFINLEQQRKKKAIVINLNGVQQIQIKPQKNICIQHDSDDKMVHIRITQTFKANIKSGLFWTPFNIIDMHISCSIEKVKLKDRTYRFNCMSTQHYFLLHTNQSDSAFGFYQLAPGHFQVKYTNQHAYPFRDDYNEQKYKDSNNQAFNYSHFKISAFQKPSNSILTIMFPLLIIGLIGLFVYFQQQSFGARLATVAVLILALIAFFPTINQQIIPSPNIKLVDLLIYSQLASAALLLIESFDIREHQSENYQFKWRENSYFFGSLVINILDVFVMFLLIICHKIIWKPRYKKRSFKKQVIKFYKFRRDLCKSWTNQECRKKFMNQSIQNRKNLVDKIDNQPGQH